MRIANYRGKWCVILRADGKRHRFSLGLDATDQNYPAAERKAAEFRSELAKPVTNTIRDIFNAYREDSTAITKPNMVFVEKSITPFFGNLEPEHITRQKCREYTEKRRKDGRKDGTIIKELSHLRAAVNWHNPHSGAVFEIPPAPEPKDRWLTKKELKSLMDAAAITPHLVLFLHLAIATGARKEAILSLTWPQIRWEQKQIWLGRKPGGKSRATIPMTDSVEAALKAARKSATTGFVIEFEGKAVKSIKRSFASACRRAKLEDVTPHVLRHSAAVWMAAADVPMSKIAQYLGHSDSRITERIYARFSPGHLKDAARALDL